MCRDRTNLRFVRAAFNPLIKAITTIAVIFAALVVNANLVGLF